MTELQQAVEHRLVVAAVARRVMKAREDEGAFMSLVIRQEPEQTPIVMVAHHQLFLDFTDAHPRCVVRMPPGTGKTFLAAVKVMHRLGEDATARAAFISDSQGQAEKPFSMVRSYIEQPGAIHAVFPELAPSPRHGDHWTQTKLVVARPTGIRDPSLHALGIGGKLLGARLSDVVVDDILSYENTRTAEACLETRRWFSSTVLTRRDVRSARILVTNTPWSMHDLTYALEESGWPSLTMDIEGNVWIRNTDWDSDLIRPSTSQPLQYPTQPGATQKDIPVGPYRLTAHDAPRYLDQVYGDKPRPALELDAEDVVPLWPERFDRAWIEAQKNDPEVALTWGPNYMCTCRDDASARCKVEWIEKCKSAARDAGLYRMPRKLDGLTLIGAYTGVDLAFSKRKTSDQVAIVTIGVLPNYKRLVLDVEVGRFVGSLVIDKVFQKHTTYQSIVMVETNSAQVYLKQWANERNIGVPIRSHQTTAKNKWDPRHGVETIFVEIEQGAWLFPNAAQTHRCELPLQALLDDCTSYDPKEHTGDCLMALWLAREQARASGALLRPSQEQGPGLQLR